MSSRLPASAKAKDRERKARERHPKQIGKTRRGLWLSRASRATKVPGILFAILSGMLTLLTYFPRLTIADNGTVRSRDPMGTVFNLTNGGVLPVFDVEQGCAVDITDENGRPRIRGLNVWMRPLGYLGPGDTKSLNCQHVASGFNSPTSMTVRIRYRPLFWFRKFTKAFPLEAEKKDDGSWVWKSE